MKRLSSFAQLGVVTGELVTMIFASLDSSAYLIYYFSLLVFSGGPCVNQSGEVIGILSRADPADPQRCYLVPTTEFKKLIKASKRRLKSTIMEGVPL